MNVRLQFSSMILPAVLGWIILSGNVHAQQKKQSGEEELVLRVYQVADMLLPAVDYEYEGEQLPTTGKVGRLGGFSSGGTMGGGMMGGMGGGMGGGGMFSVPSESVLCQAIEVAPNAPVKSRQPGGMTLNFDSLIECITQHIAPESWDGMGGPGSISPMGTLLVVRQTPAIHDQIAAFLETIRSQGGQPCSVTVQARWLLLDSDQLNELYGAKNNLQPKIERSELERLTREDTSYRGRITCFSGQRVFIVAGRRENVLHSGIPVVGSQIGYQAISVVPNIGILLQVRPTLLPSKEAVILDLRSTVTDWQDSDGTDPRLGARAPDPQSIHVPSASSNAVPTQIVPMDHVKIKAQELATTLRMPLGEPVLVGGLTLVPMEQPAREMEVAGAESNDPNQPQGLVKKLTKRREREQLYLVVEVTSD
ncbi:MAG: hypothetical protein JW829_13825 [Pirellulales bacterium]|nr:hypothetical protein [Pirellulales bacterium]